MTPQSTCRSKYRFPMWFTMKLIFISSRICSLLGKSHNISRTLIFWSLILHFQNFMTPKSFNFNFFFRHNNYSHFSDWKKTTKFFKAWTVVFCCVQHDNFCRQLGFLLSEDYLSWKYIEGFLRTFFKIFKAFQRVWLMKFPLTMIWTMDKSGIPLWFLK